MLVGLSDEWMTFNFFQLITEEAVAAAKKYITGLKKHCIDCYTLCPFRFVKK